MRIFSRHTFATTAKAMVFTGVLALVITSLDAFAQTKIRVGRTTGASGFHIPSYVAMEKASSSAKASMRPMWR